MLTRSFAPRSHPQARLGPASTNAVATAKRGQRQAPLAANTKLDALRLAVIGLIIISIGRIHHHFPILMVLRPALLLVAIGVGYVLLKPDVVRKAAALRTWPAKVVLWLFVWACLSAPFGLSMGASGHYITANFYKVIVFWFLLIVTLQGLQDLSRTLWAYLGAVGILTYFSLFVFQSGQQEHVVRLTGDDMYMYDANDLGVMLNMAVPLALLAMHTAEKRGKVIAAILLVAIVATIAVTGSRGGFVGFVCTGGALFFLLNRISIAKRLASVAVLVVTIMIAAPAGYWEQMRTITDTTENYNYKADGGRLQIWKRGIEYMKARPIFGVGIANFGRAEGTISSLAKNYRPGDAGLKFQAPHNSFVQAGAELGVPGLIMFSGLVFGGIIGMLRLRQKLPKAWAEGTQEQRFIHHAAMFLPVAWIGFGATGAFVSFAYLDPIYILAAFTAGVYARAYALLGLTPDGRQIISPRQPARSRSIPRPHNTPQ